MLSDSNFPLYFSELTIFVIVLTNIMDKKYEWGGSDCGGFLNLVYHLC
jgi:hypothetical protein